ncbi:hypothetical protein VC116063_003285B, partial [Vibrio cholerae O1 str. 116063]
VPLSRGGCSCCF